MKRIYVVMFGALLAAASIAAAHSPVTHFAYGPPAPLCPPESPDCGTGGPN